MADGKGGKKEGSQAVGEAKRIAELSKALDEARSEISRLRTRVHSLEREIPRSRQSALPKRGVISDISRHLVDEAIALNKYGCSHGEIAERLRLKEVQVSRILENPQRAREDASY